MIQYIKSALVKSIAALYMLALVKVLSLILSKEEFADYFVGFNAALYISTIFFGLQGAIILRYWKLYGESKTLQIAGSIDFPSLFILSVVTIFSFLYDIYISIIVLFALLLGVYNNFVSYFRITNRLNDVLGLVLIQASVAIVGVKIFEGGMQPSTSLIVVSVSMLLGLVVFNVRKIFRFSQVLPKDNLIESVDSIKYALPIVLIGLFTFTLSTMDQFFLKFYGNKDLALYVANYTIAEKPVLFMLSIIVFVFVPKLFNKYPQIKIAVFFDVFRMVGLFLLVSVVIFPFYILFHENISRILINQGYVEGSWILPWVAGSTILLGVNSILSEIFTVSYKTMILLFCYLVGFLTNFSLNIFLIEMYGVVGAVGSTIASYAAMLLATLVFVIREYLVVKKVCMNEI